MTHIAVVQPGSTTTVPSGQQYGAKYSLIGPDGTRIVFNDPTDRDYVGFITEITGLDSPETRENADVLVEADGGIHGNFYHGRRPVTLSGRILTESIVQRETAMTKIKRATNAMRDDARLEWIPDGGVPQQILVRRQQPLRFTGAWQKEFQIALVSADHRIYGATFNIAQAESTGEADYPGFTFPMTFPLAFGSAPPTGETEVENQGNEATPPLLTVYGPGVNPVITNFTTGESIRIMYTLGTDEYLAIDTASRTVTLNNTASRYSAVDFLNTDWWLLQPGLNDIRLSWSSYSPGAALVVQWRDAWI